MMAYCLRAWLEKILPWSTDRYRTAHVSPTKCQNAAHSLRFKLIHETRFSTQKMVVVLATLMSSREVCVGHSSFLFGNKNFFFFKCCGPTVLLLNKHGAF